MVDRSPSHDPSLILKATPPRLARGLLQRDRLSLATLDAAGTQVLAVLAPTGFGKTSQLAQWRWEAASRGSLAFWLTLDARDEPRRFVSALAHSAHGASGRRGFDDDFIEWLERLADPREAITAWMAEVARLSLDVLLVLDEVDRAPVTTRTQLIAYLLGNAPANLRIALGARPASALTASGELSRTPHTRVLASDLRFQARETNELIAAAVGAAFDAEAALRLHELTEGWPLGVQMAIAAIRRTGELSGLLDAATADIRRYFVDTLIDQQSHDDVQLLVRVAAFDPIHPDLCAAALGREDVRDDLRRLVEETPILLQAEGSDWLRMHPVAREALIERRQRLPEADRLLLARRASQWLSSHDLNEAAAEQALLAGDTAAALDLAERSVQRMLTQGRVSAVLEWKERLPDSDLATRPGFWIPTAWALGMSERHAEAAPLLEAVMRNPEAADQDRFEAELIQATIASFRDQADELTRLMARWPELPAFVRPDLIPIYWVARAFAALNAGQPDVAQLQWRRIGSLDRAQVYTPMAYGFADVGVGLSYLWEGHPGLAEQALRPALARAEERMDRRNLVACMLAALLAQARWESGDDKEPTALMTLRLDVLERQGLPDALLSAYLTLARIAEDQGRQDRALTLLEALRALGTARDMPRLQFAAQCEMVRHHAREGRAETARSLSRQLAAQLETRRSGLPRTFLPWLELQVELAHAHAAMSQSSGERLVDALQALEAAGSLAASLNLGREVVESKLLRAEVLRRRQDPEAGMLLAEATSLANAHGLTRLLARHGHSAAPTAVATVPAPDDAGAEDGANLHGVPSGPGGGVLTMKEREVLSLLAQNLSNKEVARAMDLSEQTVKWHVKNLFAKLGGTSRKHAVARARILGLLGA